MSLVPKFMEWLYIEFGLASVYATGRNVWLVILARTCRMFAYGAASLIIALFLSSLGFSDSKIGLFMTLTLAGDVLLSLVLTLIADAVGRRHILFAGASLMIVSGIVFAFSKNFWMLLVAAVVGVMNATGGDTGPFRAIEESILSHLTTPRTRSDVLSWYVTMGSLGAAAGSEVSGRIVEYLQKLEGWTLTDAYHAVFWLYIGMGVLMMILAISLSNKCEIAQKYVEIEVSERLLDEREEAAANGNEEEEDGERDHSNGNSKSAPTQDSETPQKKNVFAQISSDTRWIMYKLWFLLTVDSLADGMTWLSLTYYYMDQKFDISKSSLGDITSISYFLSSCSTVFAGPLARHLGLINTMVFTHLPSSAAVLLFPLPRGLPLTVTLFFIRTGFNNMDQAPRAAFIAAVVKPEERTAVLGVTNMLRTLASTIGPTITGVLAGNERFWIAFVVAGALRICYDVGLFAMFVNMKLYTHEPKAEAAAPRRSMDEEEMTELTQSRRPND